MRKRERQDRVKLSWCTKRVQKVGWNGNISEKQERGAWKGNKQHPSYSS